MILSTPVTCLFPPCPVSHDALLPISAYSLQGDETVSVSVFKKRIRFGVVGTALYEPKYGQQEEGVCRWYGQILPLQVQARSLQLLQPISRRAKIKWRRVEAGDLDQRIRVENRSDVKPPCLNPRPLCPCQVDCKTRRLGHLSTRSFYPPTQPTHARTHTVICIFAAHPCTNC